MATMAELGKAVHARRAEMGLTQSYLATLSGLSRQTINQVENGTVANLSLNRAERLANVLGLSLQVTGRRAGDSRNANSRLPPLARAARAASVSFRDPLEPDRLRDVLRGTTPPGRYLPHLHAFLDEAPVSLLASVVGQLQDEEGTRPAHAWAQLRGLARQVKSRRDIWQ